MWVDGNGFGVWGDALMNAVLFWGLLFVGGCALLLIHYLGERSMARRRPLEQILAERLAAGEIDQRVYERCCEVLCEQRRPLVKP